MGSSRRRGMGSFRRRSVRPSSNPLGRASLPALNGIRAGRDARPAVLGPKWVRSDARGGVPTVGAKWVRSVGANRVSSVTARWLRSASGESVRSVDSKWVRSAAANWVRPVTRPGSPALGRIARGRVMVSGARVVPVGPGDRATSARHLVVDIQEGSGRINTLSCGPRKISDRNRLPVAAFENFSRSPLTICRYSVHSFETPV